MTSTVMHKEMAERLIKLPSEVDLNPKLETRHWVNEVTPEQYHLFMPTGVSGPEVRPLLYDQLSTQWILKHHTGTFISVLEIFYKPCRLVPYGEEPLTEESLIESLTTRVLDLKYEPLELESFGGNQPTEQDMRKWRPWNLQKEDWSKWIRHQLQPGALEALNKAHAPSTEWSDEIVLGSIHDFREMWGVQFRPVLTQTHEEYFAAPSLIRVAFHVYEKTFYVWNEATSHYRMAKLLKPDSDEPANEEAVLDWLEDYGYEKDAPTSVLGGVRLVARYKMNFEKGENREAIQEKEEEPLKYKIMKPWTISEHGTPGVAGIDDWEEWLPDRDESESSSSYTEQVRPPGRTDSGTTLTEFRHGAKTRPLQKSSPPSSQTSDEGNGSRASQSSNTPPSSIRTSPPTSPPSQLVRVPAENVVKPRPAPQTQSTVQPSQSSSSSKGKGKAAKRR